MQDVSLSIRNHINLIETQMYLENCHLKISPPEKKRFIQRSEPLLLWWP